VFTEISPMAPCAEDRGQSPKTFAADVGLLHGGVLLSMIESMGQHGGLCLARPRAAGMVLESTKHGLPALHQIGAGVRTAEPLHRGRAAAVVGGTVTDDADRVVARGQVRMQTLEPEPG